MQALPFADEEVLETLEKNAGTFARISSLIADGMTNKELLDRLMNGIEYDVFDELNVAYKCTCNRERMCEAIRSMGEKQVRKLEDVRHIRELKREDSVYRELCMIKVEAHPEDRTNLASLSEIFRANIIDVGTDSLIIELTGNQGKIDAFLKLLDGYKILELARTGIAGLTRGSENVVWLETE